MNKLAILSAVSALAFGSLSAVAAEADFSDDFGSGSVNSAKWYVGKTNFDDYQHYYSGGVVPANVQPTNGVLRCEVHGQRYAGKVMGVMGDHCGVASTTNVGACVVTRGYYASGRYEIVAKVAPVPGVCCVMRTYAKSAADDKPHEIVFQIPAPAGSESADPSFSYAFCRNKNGKDHRYDWTTSYAALGAAQDDGWFHTYRFDWHTGGNGETARVEFYVDGVLKQTNTDHVPTMAGRLWIGAWCPETGCGVPEFDTSAFEIKSVSITPFNEANDVAADEKDPTAGLVEPSEIYAPAWDDDDDDDDDDPGDEYVAPDPLFDDFDQGFLDSDRWYAAKKNWGGKIKDENGKATDKDYNGGVIPENLYVKDGILCCEAHGDNYLGDLIGWNKDLSARPDGKRVGACAVTKDYYASGRYEIRAKVAPTSGVCCAMWTFEYEEIYDKSNPQYVERTDNDGYYVVNHEIDIEMPGRPDFPHENIGYDYALCNTWIGEKEATASDPAEYTTGFTRLEGRQDDGQFHTYRFDWHTGGTNTDGTVITPRVEFYFDGKLLRTNTTHIPYKAGRLWIGAWFPNGWAGKPDFDTSVFEVDWVRITPFGEPNDRPAKESYASDGMKTPLNVLPPERWNVGSPDASSVTAYVTEKGKLVFNGAGAVRSFASPEEMPWASVAQKITALAYESGVIVVPDTLNLPNLATVNGKAFAPTVAPQTEAFYDDFSSGIVDPAKWFAANKNWGGKVEKWSEEDYNGGVVPQNLFVTGGKLQCVAHGNDYEGDIIGIAKPGSNKIAMPRANGKRVGACAVTKDYYASGSYEICARVAPSSGVCCTMWTFEYEELYYGDEGFPANLGEDDYYVVNHEIDIEMPGRPKSAHENISYEYALCNTWVGEKGNEYTTGYTKLPKRQDDGGFHTYRFDWHTGGIDPVTGTNIEKRVEFYFDGELVRTNTENVPTKAGRLWVGAWFPNGWAGTPGFDTDVFEVDWVKITPFNEPGDEPAHETFGKDGLAAPYNIDTRSVWNVGTPVASSVKAHVNGNNEIVFSGSGAVKSFASVTDAPWGAYADRLTGAKVPEGVTFGKGAQTGLSELACVSGVPTALWNGDTTDEAWGVFYDDFTSGIVDPAKWYAANKNWGGDIELDGVGGQNYNGGVVAENLYVKDNKLQCEAHGSLYEGDVIGITKGGDRRKDGKRVGACAVTKDYYASGRYEIRAKVAPAKGVCCTMWTFEYEEHYPGETDYTGSGAYSVVNHEIDIEMPGRPQDDGKFENVGYDYALCNTWIGEKGDEYTASHMKLPKRQDDGEFHTYRFDWHSGNESGTIRPRVEFYFDGVLVQINYSFIPFKAGRFWVGAWFPRGWAGTPNFDTSVFEVDWVKITPYFEENDRPQNETFGDVENQPESWTGLRTPLNVVPPPFWEVGDPVASDVIARIDTNGVLTLTGKGAVQGFVSAAEAPWAEYARDIREVKIYDSWQTSGPYYLYSKDWVQHWGYETLEGDMTLASGSLAGLDGLEKLNGTPLTTFSQVLTSLGGVAPVPLRVDSAALRVDSAAKQAEIDLSVLRSSDGVNWTPVDATVQKGSDGTSLKVSASAASGK